MEYRDYRDSMIDHFLIMLHERCAQRKNQTQCDIDDLSQNISISLIIPHLRKYPFDIILRIASHLTEKVATPFVEYSSKVDLTQPIDTQWTILFHLFALYIDANPQLGITSWFHNTTLFRTMTLSDGATIPRISKLAIDALLAILDLPRHKYDILNQPTQPIKELIRQ